MGWTEIINTSGDFAMCGVYTGGKLLLGGYGSGELYSYSPFAVEATGTGESILGMCVLNGEVYATSENNDTVNYRTKVYKRTGSSWIPSETDGYAAYFMCVWGNTIVITVTADLATIHVCTSTDGVNFNTFGPRIEEWLWVPVVYNNELYMLGHTGGAEGPGTAKGVKWNGSSWSDVPALCGVPLEWQCGVEHNGFLFLGGGGWTLGRADSQATIYRFDGVNCTPVFNDPAYHEVQAFLSSGINGILHASFGYGFKNDVGGSQIWVTGDNGATWVAGGYFADCPQLYVLLDAVDGFIAAGGSQGNLRAYHYPWTTPTPTPEPTPEPGPTPIPNPSPTPNTNPFCDSNAGFFAAVCPRCYSGDVTDITGPGFGFGGTNNTVFKCNQCHAVFDTSGNLTGV